MAVHYSAATWVVILCSTVLLRADGAVSSIEPEVSVDNDLICPDRQDISPCTCIITSTYAKHMDCSKVKSEDELEEIFSKPFPANNFHGFFMHNNKFIRTIRNGVFKDKTFGFLLITDSSLVTVEPGALLGSAKTLYRIHISNNHLKSFPFEELPKYDILETLYLGHNAIGTMPTVESASLMDVYLDDNPIHSIPTDALKDVPKLKVFSCNSCNIGELLPGTFTTQPFLRSVKLDKNHLTHLPEGVIKLHGLTTELSLRANRLVNVSAGAFTGLSFRVDIDDNQLQQLYEDVWRPSLEGVNFFSASGNPFLCDCNIAWLVTNRKLMSKLFGAETCSDGTLLTQLDKLYYQEKCQDYL